MKTIIIFFLIIYFTGQSISQPVWNFQNSGTTNNLNRITIKYDKAGQSLFIAGDNGTILRSSSSGLIWETVNSNTSSDLYSMEISYDDTGYAVGAQGTIIKTADGGNSWTVMNSNTTNSLKEIRMMNGSIRVIAVGDNGTFLKLQNDVWSVSQIDTTDLNSIDFENSNPNRMIAVGDYGKVLRTTNSGLNWSSINSNTFNNLNYISEGLIVVGDNGTAFQITGTNINTIKFGTKSNLYSYQYQFSNFLAMVCGDNGIVLKFWQPVPTNTNLKLNSITQTNADNCFVVGEKGSILFTNTLNITSDAKQLTSNNISTWFINNGSFNRNAGTGNSGFEWPKGSGKFARYSSGLLLTAIVKGDTLVTTCEYGSEYLPGYTENNGVPQGSKDPDYKLYKMIFNVNDPVRINWPNVLLGNSDQGAPVFYDAGSGQWRPVDYGNQTMFYSYTDSYPEAHIQPSGMTSPLKADIKQINWSFNQPEELKNIIYQEFRIINRSNSVWTNAYINLYSDDDLGNSSDDKAGVDTNVSLAYTFNAADFDQVYGAAPPAVGFAVIRGPLIFTGNKNDSVFYCEGKGMRVKRGYKETRLHSTVIYKDDGLQPHNYSENYNAMRGLQNDGTPYVNPTTGELTRFVYSGDPITGAGWLYPGESDARFYQGFGPLNMNPGDTQVIVIVQVIARGTNNRFSISELRATSQQAKNFYNDCFSNVVIGVHNISTEVPEEFKLYQNYPNPFNPVTNIEFEVSKSGFVSLKIYDMSGKEVATLLQSKISPGKYKYEFNGTNLSSGVYFYQIKTDEKVLTRKMTMIK